MDQSSPAYYLLSEGAMKNLKSGPTRYERTVMRSGVYVWLLVSVAASFVPVFV